MPAAGPDRAAVRESKAGGRPQRSRRNGPRTQISKEPGYGVEEADSQMVYGAGAGAGAGARRRSWVIIERGPSVAFVLAFGEPRGSGVDLFYVISCLFLCTVACIVVSHATVFRTD